jgi:methylmalonyl-CoA mutase, C-terminal domain
MPRKIRVLVGKPGLDGHDRGAKVVAAALRDAGMEVIYTGLHQTAEQVVEAALQEDVDVVALSILSGAHMTLFPEINKLMRARGLSDRLLTGGGIIPPEDMDTLATMGVGRLFGPGSSTQDIVAYIRAWFATQHGADALTPLPPPRDPKSFVPAGSSPAHRGVKPVKSAARSAAKPRPAAKKRKPAAKAKPTASKRTVSRTKPAPKKKAARRR